MIAASIGGAGLQQTTHHRVVLPFYVYAALSFLLATALLFWHTDIANTHHFNPYTLAITHTMALGWGTMIILGASHQLVPVLIEGKLYSYRLAMLSFIFTALGIPLLVTAFYVFNTGWPMIGGAALINLGVLFYVINVCMSSFKSKLKNVHAWFIICASLWLLATVLVGLLLVCNFSHPIFPQHSVAYLSLHAHLGLVGWFLLLIIGVGSRLIPMFLISKYSNDKKLWQIFACINAGLLAFVVFQIVNVAAHWYYLPIAAILAGIVLFGIYCRKAYLVRIRKAVDEQMKTSLLSVMQMLLPLLVLFISLVLLPIPQVPRMAILYGFSIFFGWITAIILGMTFKTLPFIVWNKVYHQKAQHGRTPAPKDLFSEKIYHAMLLVYLTGFVLYIFGIIIASNALLLAGAAALLVAALLYVCNVFITLLHKPSAK